MAKGQKYNDDIKEKAYALLACNNNVSYVAEKLGLPRTTVKSWKEAYDKKAKESGEESIAELRQKKKEEFVEEAWGLIGKTQTLLERRLNRAIESENVIDELLNEILNPIKDSEGETVDIEWQLKDITFEERVDGYITIHEEPRVKYFTIAENKIYVSAEDIVNLMQLKSI